MCWGLGKSVFARAPSRINQVRYWRPLSGLFLFLRRLAQRSPPMLLMHWISSRGPSLFPTGFAEACDY
jgi:hypothetical protein